MATASLSASRTASITASAVWLLSLRIGGWTVRVVVLGLEPQI